jgi:hypothetical protein
MLIMGFYEYLDISFEILVITIWIISLSLD